MVKAEQASHLVSTIARVRRVFAKDANEDAMNDLATIYGLEGHHRAKNRNPPYQRYRSVHLSVSAVCGQPALP